MGDFCNLFSKYGENGTMTRQQFRWCLKEDGQHLSEQEFSRIFKFFDKSNNGRIDIEDFTSRIVGTLVHPRFWAVDEVWGMISNGNNTVSTAELT